MSIIITSVSSLLVAVTVVVALAARVVGSLIALALLELDETMDGVRTETPSPKSAGIGVKRGAAVMGSLLLTITISGITRMRVSLADWVLLSVLGRRTT